ncbi:CCL3 protein, partial [Sterrhoptilus dennistouni]|nr:CCL3 protein [Sterrhoptilus dennistouni]
MRVPAAALAVLLLAAICSLAQADLRVSRSAGHPEDGIKGMCCFSTISHPIPRSRILSAYRTSNTCPMEAVVLVIRKGKQVCADPKAHWVQKYLKDFEFVDF